MQSAVLSASVMMGVFAIGCSAPAEETPLEETSLDVETGGLREMDFGNSYNGWTHTISALQFSLSPEPGWGVVSSGAMTRNSGDNTRGGGVCLVYQRTASPSSCTNGAAGDTACTNAAQAQFGSSAYGYCYNSKCYDRRYSQTAHCNVNPNRSPGQYVTNGGPSDSIPTPAMSNHAWTPYLLGCMTKTAGPNTACGGTDQSLYMRHVVASTL